MKEWKHQMKWELWKENLTFESKSVHDRAPSYRHADLTSDVRYTRIKNSHVIVLKA